MNIPAPSVDGAPAVERPKLRPGLAAAPHTDPNLLVIHDPLGIGQAVVVSHLAVEVAQRFDGSATVVEIAEAVRIQFPQAQVSAEVVAGLAAAMDEACLLDSVRLRAQFDGPVRKPACLAGYGDNPAELRNQLSGLFTAPGGAGLPGESRESPDRLRAVLVPHMDYGRGNITYGHGFKELIEQSAAEVFVIIGTSHYSGARFTLSRQHFDTPLGLVETDTDYVDRIAAGYGEGVYEDPLAHVPEHSIELEVALLKFLLADRRPFKIVPLLVGSFHDCMRANASPAEAEDIARMVRVLREAEAACPRPVCYVISGDLAHIGPKFGDKRKAAEPWMAESRASDGRILKTLETARPGDFYDEIAADKNARRICGLSPTWLTLDVTRPKAGKVLHYQQYVHPQGKESVSFAAAAFYG
jgi:AmmeMemoRadiSam system protein B